MIKAADMLIARRADTRARADFATWKMLAKLNGTSSLPAEAQNFLASYSKLLKQMKEAEASEAIIGLMYKSYYSEMGGAGTPPDVPSRQAEPIADNVTAFRRPAPARPKANPKDNAKANTSGANTKPRLPVALIFTCLVLVYVGIRFYWR